MQDKLDCQHNFCGWSYLFKGTEEKDLWNLLSSPLKPSQEQWSHSSWVRHAKMDTVRTESTSSLSSLCFSLHHSSPFHCLSSCICYDGSSVESQTSDSREAPHRASLQEVQRLDIHHWHRLLYYAHQTHSAHHLSEKLLDQEQVETGKISSWQLLPVLIIFPFPPDNAHTYFSPSSTRSTVF